VTDQFKVTVFKFGAKNIHVYLQDFLFK
jgi:hypothetical protein